MLIDIRNEKDSSMVRFDAEYKHPKIGLTSGCFDLFHSLHLAYLQKCRRLCDVLIVGVDADDLVRKTKGDSRPIIPEHQRVMLINALQCVDVSFIMGSLEDWEIAIGSFRPAFLFKNTDFKPDEVINPFDTEVVIIPDVSQPDSTTQIINEILKKRK